MITVEDGTGLPNADTYISVADADQYHLRYGNEEWDSLSETEKETSLIKASRDIGLLFSFIGDRLHPETQALEFPRTRASGVPRAVSEATAEMALISLGFDPSGPLSGDGNIKSLEQEVGDLKRKTEYFNASASTEQTQLRRVNLLLKGLLASGSSGSLVMRIERG